MNMAAFSLLLQTAVFVNMYAWFCVNKVFVHLGIYLEVEGLDHVEILFNAMRN